MIKIAIKKSRKVSDSEQLLRTMSRFEETKFLIYLNAEAPVLRKNAKRSLLKA